jgi:hypothetical protein
LTPLAGADIRRFSSDRRGMALNFFLGVGNGALQILADTLIHPTLILVLFAAELTDSYPLIGLVPALATGLWWLPQLVGQAIVQGRRRQMPWAVAASLVRAASIGLIGYIAYKAENYDNDELFRSFLICYAAYNIAGGFAALPSNELITKGIASERRALFIQQRNLWGIALGVAAGFVVREVLGDSGPDFPKNFGLIFLASAVALITATFLQARMREPIRVISGRRISILRQFVAGPKAFADANFRRFLLFRIALGVSLLADPFFVIYAQRELQAPGKAIGGYLIAMTLARFLAHRLWTTLQTRKGNRAVLQYAALVRIAAPAIALVLPYAVKTTFYEDHVTDSRVPYIIFGGVFVAIGIALSGFILSNFGYAMELAPNDARPAYVGMANAVLGIVSFVMVFGGSLLDRRGYETLFATASVAGLVAVFAGGVLTQTHTRAQTTAQAWGLRRART